MKRDEMEVFRAWDRWVDEGGGDYRAFAGKWLEGVEWAGRRLTAAQGAALGGIVEGYVAAAMARHRSALGAGADGTFRLQREFADLRLHDSVEDALAKDAESFGGMSRQEVASALRRENGWFGNFKRRLLDRRALGLAGELGEHLTPEERAELDGLFAGDGPGPEDARDSGEPETEGPIDWAGQERAEQLARALRDGNIASRVAEATPEELDGEDERCLHEGLGSPLCSGEEETLKKVYALGLLGTMLPFAGGEAWEAWQCALFAGHRALDTITALKAAVHRERLAQALEAAETWPGGGDAGEKED